MEDSNPLCEYCGYADNRAGWRSCERCSISRAVPVTTVSVKTQTIWLSDHVSLEMVWCPPGSFEMGSPDNESGRDADEKLHLTTLKRGFWIGKYPVTQAQWLAIRDDNPSAFVYSNHPVEKVSWNQCQNFIIKLNEKHVGHGFRLPTEAEWEYACRAGVESPSPCVNPQRKFARYGCKSTSEVGTYEPNAWGLCDILGNVWEWCQDEYIFDPSCCGSFEPCVKKGPYRVKRGGAYDSFLSDCRSARRNYDKAATKVSNTGFRIVARGGKESLRTTPRAETHKDAKVKPQIYVPPAIPEVEPETKSVPEEKKHHLGCASVIIVGIILALLLLFRT